MSKSRVIVLSVVQQGLTKAEVARKYGVTWQWVHTLVTRYEQDGEAGLEPRSRAPQTNKNETPPGVTDRIIELRSELKAEGFDAGPLSIRDRLLQEGLPAPSGSTISRILKRSGLVIPEPRKRPKSSYIRFEADQPNETWQSDFTHWRLADGTEVEIINWLDDHSRYLLSLHAHPRITGEIVIDTFSHNIDHYGLPASTLTDNGSVYTSRFTGGRNGFEYLLAALGVRQKNGSPGHPQTQGKVERFHQTQKKWLAARPPAETLPELQHQLQEFQHAYNTKRPHRSLDGHTPEHAYHATIKATPQNLGDTAHYRIRIDRLDSRGKATLRRAGKMHHLGVREENARKRVLMLIDDTTVTVTELTTGEVLSQHLIDPDRNYWPDHLKPAGRWPSNTSAGL
ncbi:MAG: IS481 family transposase [Pontimonas sp.]|nr:IS481 family transposase [Pontimonas sp.]